MKNVLFLVGDHCRHAKTIQLLTEMLFPEAEYNVIITEDPQELMKTDTVPNLFISFKAPVDNDRFPTSAWCSDEWTRRFFEFTENGMGIMLVHAAVTDLEADHPIARKVIDGIFTGNSEACSVTFRPLGRHPIISNVKEFTFPENAEHYKMAMFGSTDTMIIAETKSRNGVQPAMWVKQTDRYRVCCLTPGHTMKNLLCGGYVNVLKNAAEWCCS